MVKKEFMLLTGKLIQIFNSSHPYDKGVVKELVDNGMKKEELIQFKDLLIKIAQACYGQDKNKH